MEVVRDRVSYKGSAQKSKKHEAHDLSSKICIPANLPVIDAIAAALSMAVKLKAAVVEDEVDRGSGIESGSPLTSEPVLLTGGDVSDCCKCDGW